MARKVSFSQLKSILRQAEQKQRRAIDDYNRLARRHNQEVRRAIDKYNQEVRAYNSRVRANRQRLKNELAKLRRQSTTAQYVVFRTSVQSMHHAYTRLEQCSNTVRLGSNHEEIMDLSEREAANSVEVMNSLLGSEPASSNDDVAHLQTVLLENELRQISPDLDSRWRGAVFSLNPKNPDAARHFCTSAREVFTQILDLKAPDHDVIDIFPECEKTDQGKPTRRAKIRFILHMKEMAEGSLEEFVEQDMENIVELFRIFNAGTHGSVGKFNRNQLASIKKRVEDGITFLSQLVN